MKSCSKCMAENADDAKFCKLCSSPLQQGGGKTCPSGKHTMDPMWTECAYCKADSAASASSARAAGAPQPPPLPRSASPGSPMVRAETVVEGGSPDSPSARSRAPLRPPTFREDTPLPPRPAPRPFAGGAPAPLGGPASVSPKTPAGSPGTPSRGNTVFGPSVSPTPPTVSKARKIVGILVTYSWRPEGKVYEVREGRNLIGRDASCDISVPEDETLSGVNSHITYRNSFVIGDMVSMMGTDLNGVPIEEQFHKLSDRAAIRAGSTHFTFIAVAGVSDTALPADE